MPEDDREFQRRLPSVERTVAGIQPEDVRVSILGTIVDKKDETVVLDDGSGKITSRFEEPVKFPAGSLVRIFGRVLPVESGYELQGEIVQDMAGLSMELHRKVREFVSKSQAASS
jgi:hypothetical protein